ncbi:myosin light chain 5 isoform X1 [Vulpes lagopus]|uniref:myosin light chain 5 isoform X1 n=1 Tax=Vulpes lagopus TaxID=494514 RepID=UPI001BCA197F|nr:myosin light chain 5 isoform X1 [Vulpes lagopus]XP_041608580.1 myosin light chain 5 isoform X1 [Vulpes lagopus]XP_041608581.1 myosin light chain 5 isoform X1 [Vulpes lagopus]XP_041608582.1 myosin light chain 5 isoform X1 [Vulpes lagopus]
MASRKTKKKEGGGLRAQRASSNVFSNFEQTQIQEFKEAFTLMDQNRDGFIDKEDLKDTYASLGRCPGRNSATTSRERTLALQPDPASHSPWAGGGGLGPPGRRPSRVARPEHGHPGWSRRDEAPGRGQHLRGAPSRGGVPLPPEHRKEAQSRPGRTGRPAHTPLKSRRLALLSLPPRGGTFSGRGHPGGEQVRLLPLGPLAPGKPRASPLPPPPRAQGLGLC